jgi:hypothetical protein
MTFAEFEQRPATGQRIPVFPTPASSISVEAIFE